MLYWLSNYEQNVIQNYVEIERNIIKRCKFYVYICGFQAMISLKQITSAFIRVPFFSTPCTYKSLKSDLKAIQSLKILD